MEYTLIEAPVSLGARTHGTEDAYSALKDDLYKIFGCREIRASKPEKDENDLLHRDGKCDIVYPGAVMKTARDVYEASRKAIVENTFPIVIGGDHSVAIGSLAAANDTYGSEELSVVWIDAHTDINTDEGSPSGFVHGMPIASALGLCRDELTIGENKPSAKGENVFVIGARSIDDEECPVIEENGVNVYKMEEIKKRGLDSVLRELISKIKTKAIHVSFDVDCLDPCCFRSSGYIIENGFLPDEVKTIIRALAKTGKVVSFDCVEYLPRLDLDECDKQTVISILEDAKNAFDEAKAKS